MLNKTKYYPWISTGTSSIFILLLVAIYFFRPEILANETVYLIPPHQMVDSTVLAFDWNIGSQNPKLSLLFNIVISPIWLLFHDAVKVALVGRILVWIFLAFTLVKFAKFSGIKQYSIVVGLFFWLSTSQNLTAGEWIFGGVEQKCFAYGFLFVSLTLIMQGKVILAGVSCGIAIWFHLLVGGWGAIAITGALGLCNRTFGWPKTIWFITVVALIFIPYLPIVYKYAVLASDTLPSNAGNLPLDELIVTVRNPHHLDPYFFLTIKNGLKVCIIVFCTIYVLPLVLSKEKSQFLTWFLMMLLLIASFGVLARPLNLYWFLKLYPFRIADVLVVLLFWLIIPQAIITKRHSLFLMKTSLSLQKIVLISMVLFALSQMPTAINNLKVRTIGTVSSWYNYRSGFTSKFAETTEWIKLNTKKKSVFVVDPCEWNFLINTERATIVSYKIAPANSRFAEWYERVKILNDDDDFGGMTSMTNTCKEIRNNFTTLSKHKLERIKYKFNAEYYLTYFRRGDLEKNLVYHNEEYYLYSLKDLSL